MAPRRIYNQSFGGNNNGRVVTIGGAGGLNERFSQLDNSSKAQGSGQGSVFNRIQPSSSRRQASSVSNRLNRPASGGIRKRTSGGPTPMTGVQFTNRRGAQRATNGRNQRLSKTINKTTRGDTGRRGGASSQRPSGKSNARKAANAKSGKGRGGDKKKQKSVTAEELDKSLDDYMMKDPKTAQSRLDAELNNYMDEANDVLMDLQ